MNPLPYFLLAYLLGSIPFALIISLPQGVDPRKEGSKNPGATNVSRLLGKKWGLLTLLGDTGKGMVALLITLLLTGSKFSEEPFLFAGVGFFAVFGHMYSFLLKFRGGKGVATMLGSFLILTPLPTLLALLFFLLIVYVVKYVSVGSLTFAILLPLLIYLFNYPPEYTISASLVSLMICLKHRDNIKRLIKGQENPWQKKKT